MLVHFDAGLESPICTLLFNFMTLPRDTGLDQMLSQEWLNTSIASMLAGHLYLLLAALGDSRSNLWTIVNNGRSSVI